MALLSLCWTAIRAKKSGAMTNAELIVELLTDTIEERASGVFRKVLDNGREVYTCKCPVCGNLHGGYRTFDEARAHLKCREHFRNEVEKTKKDIQKVDEPEKPRNIFQKSERKPDVLGETLDDEEEGLAKEVGAPIPDDVTKMWCLSAQRGDRLYHRTKTMADGSPLSVRVMGRCITWKSRPNEFRIPVKYGLHQSFYITDVNAGDWSTEPPRGGQLRSRHPRSLGAA